METIVLVPTRFQLQELLEKHEISQRELALKSGVSPTTINRMCRNLTAQVSLGTLDSLAKALGVSPGEIITDKPLPKSRRKGAA